ncbi:hypothetical protein BJ742DRAFT_679660 [Cladochytrium replicatum]|nr:hypothetical protein BJ742DRAFT_679660 [Cladochytrium replicatum]
MNAREVKLWWKSNFVKGLGFGVCRGPYPKILLDRWDQYASEKGTENDRPDYFDESQLFAVLILEHGGVDLEHSIDKLDSYGEIRSILQQCAVSLAIAEQRLRFEHRDLHWGNLLIKRPEVTSTQCVRSGEPTNEVVAMYRVPVDSGGSRMVRVSTHNIKVCLIDFTLSRLELDGQLFHVPMDDESFFTGEGDYQYDVYRSMRKHTRRRWKGYHPVTNVLWMDYLIDKLLSAPILVHRAKSTKKVPKPDRKKDNTAMLLSKAVTNPTKERAEIVSLHKRVRSGTYESVGDLVLNDPFFAGIFVG